MLLLGLYTTIVNVIEIVTVIIPVLLGFGCLGGINGRQSWLEDDILVSLSTPGPTYDMVLGVVGPLAVGIATYSPRSLLTYAI